MYLTIQYELHLKLVYVDPMQSFQSAFSGNSPSGSLETQASAEKWK